MSYKPFKILIYLYEKNAMYFARVIIIIVNQCNFQLYTNFGTIHDFKVVEPSFSCIVLWVVNCYVE